MTKHQHFWKSSQEKEDGSYFALKTIWPFGSAPDLRYAQGNQENNFHYRRENERKGRSRWSPARIFKNPES